MTRALALTTTLLACLALGGQDTPRATEPQDLPQDLQQANATFTEINEKMGEANTDGGAVGGA